ncbi:ABC transporter permease [Rummeliibacillus sp. NPDC094406]|uniref:ABC transporter permease n=1 Tax=Rummeliibacillus sp. NPDC094406 TaxID=3364511 RepID=UPI003810433D
MNFAGQVLKEQFLHLNLIFRLSLYEEKGKYTMHYLGALWQILNPFIQIGVYWLIFGLGIRKGSPVDGTPFFLWLIIGLVPWLYISRTITQASNSVFAKVNLVSKMHFPVSVLPTIKIVGNSISLIPMLIITIGIALLYGIFSGAYLIQLIYYLICLYFLLFAITLLLSTLTTIIRDVQMMVQSIVRLLMFFLPIVWNVHNFPDFFVNILKLNPLFYIIEGFRFSILGGQWFFEDLPYTVYFWSLSILILTVGSFLHIKFRNKFVDYL